MKYPDGDKPRSASEHAWLDYTHHRSPSNPPPFTEDFARFRSIYENRSTAEGPPPAWWPSDREIRQSNLSVAMAERGERDYESFRRFSSERRGAFWELAIKRLGIRFRTEPVSILPTPVDPKKPRWLEGATLNIADSCFNADAEHTAIRFASETNPELTNVSYHQLKRLSAGVAGALEEHGVLAGQSVALYMPMNVECVAAYLGIVRAGCRVVSIADSFTAKEVERRVKIADTKLLVTQDVYLRAGKRVALYDKIRDADRPSAVVVQRESDLRIDDRDIVWSRWISDREDFDSHEAAANDITNILFSSGTTGTPKAIPWTHLTPIKAATDGHFHQDIQPRDVVAWPTNIGWMMGPWLIYASLINRATIALFEGAPLGAGFIEFIDRARVSILGLIPSIVKAWKKLDDFTPDSLDDVRLFSSTGEPSNLEDYLWLMSRAHYRAPIIEYLGGTEIGGGHLTGSVLRASAPENFSTPSLGLDFAILSEEGTPVAEGDAGELFLVPPSIGLSETLLNKDHDAVYYGNTPKGPNGETLRRHGDEIARLGRGYFAARGRADDTMNLGGIKVSSVELEQALNRHPAVYETAAVAVRKKEDPADRLVVFVVLKNQIDAPTLSDQLQALLRDELNPLFRIHDVVIAKELPRTASNKIMRRSLRDTYA